MKVNFGSVEAMHCRPFGLSLPLIVDPYPHNYVATARGRPEGDVAVTSPALPEITTEPPPEFGGSGNAWSPETLLCASLADCLVLTFRAIARASRFDWRELDCRVEGVLERADGVAQFTRYTIFVSLGIGPDSDRAMAHKLLEKAEHSCLISNSVRGLRSLVIEIRDVA